MTTEATTPGAQPRAFDPNAHLRKIRTRQGMQDYLDVKWRLMWLRSEHPEAQIVTEQIEGDEQHARFKCTITYPHRQLLDGTTHHAIGTGHGSETLQDFPDFYEKAETKAIGRACAVLGFGTDGATDFDDGEPLDGRAAAKDERATRRADGPERTDTPQTSSDGANARPERPVAQIAAPQPPRLPSTRTARPKDAGETIPADDGNAAHLRDIAAEGPLTAPPGPIDASNVHQHAQLRALAENGFDLAAAMGKIRVDDVTGLSREQAKELIIAGRAEVRTGHAANAR
jgi:hypothetical protein